MMQEAEDTYAKELIAITDRIKRLKESYAR
jgi:hypothetical protein